jgi:hypothetical protein
MKKEPWLDALCTQDRIERIQRLLSNDAIVAKQEAERILRKLFKAGISFNDIITVLEEVCS